MKIVPKSFSASIVPTEDREHAKAMFAAIEKGVESRITAGKHWLKLSKEAQLAIYNKTPSGFRPYWERLSKIGRGEMHPLLFDLNGRAATCLSGLPVEDQADYLTNGVPLLRDNSMVMVDPSSLSSAECSQVFNSSARGAKVRGYKAQRTFVQSREER